MAALSRPGIRPVAAEPFSRSRRSLRERLPTAGRSRVDANDAGLDDGQRRRPRNGARDISPALRRERRSVHQTGQRGAVDVVGSKSATEPQSHRARGKEGKRDGETVRFLTCCLSLPPSVRLCGSVALWLCGSVALWLCSSVALWLCGSVALWLCSSVAL